MSQEDQDTSVPDDGSHVQYQWAESETSFGEESVHVHRLWRIGSKAKSDHYFMIMDIEDKTVEMEIDTGAGVSVISEEVFSKLRRGGQKLELQSSNCWLLTYTGQKIIPLVQCTVSVKYDNCEHKLQLVIIPGSGRSWLEVIRLEWKQIFYLTTTAPRGPASSAQTLSPGPDATSAPVDGLKDILDKYSGVFKVELGTMKGYTAKLGVDPNAKPVFCKARPVPFALRDWLDKELDRLEQSGIIAPIQYAEWAAPIVPGVKSDQSIRLWRL